MTIKNEIAKLTCLGRMIRYAYFENKELKE